MTKEEFIAKYEHNWGTYVEWVAGGMSGGNCYGDNPNYAVEAEPEPELDILDEILEELVPTITFLEYRRIMKDPGVILYHEWEDHEYYGNYYLKKSKKLMLDVLWSHLENIIAIPDPNVRASYYTLVKD